ncbi:MAG: hypothetical protein WCO56_23200 [Verrucomicrobiota bacterium]
MRNLKTQLVLAGVLLFSVSCLQAQKITVKSGSLEFLKGETALNVEYTYDNLTVGKGTEQAYTDKKVAEYNAKEAGKGDKWLEAWKGDRSKRFEPKFEELINKQITDRKFALKVGKNPDAKYTLVLKTTGMEPGWNVGVMRAPAWISTEAQFVETKDHSKELAVVEILKAPGRDAMGYDFDVGYRLQEGYAKTGKELGAFLSKKALK